MTFKLKSGNASAFKNLGSSPVKQKIDPTAKPWGDQYKKTQFKKMLSKDDGGVIDKTTKQLSKKGSMPKNFNTTGSSKAGKFAKVAKNVLGKAGRFLGGKALGVAGMMMATSSKADQPKKGKGKTEYPGGKIDFSKKK